MRRPHRAIETQNVGGEKLCGECGWPIHAAWRMAQEPVTGLVEPYLDWRHTSFSGLSYRRVGRSGGSR
jgi:hypothetical protein